MIEKIFHDEQVDTNRAIRSFSDRQIIATSTELGLPTYQYLDLKAPQNPITPFIAGDL
jgi:hypothetical protein